MRFVFSHPLVFILWVKDRKKKNFKKVKLILSYKDAPKSCCSIPYIITIVKEQPVRSQYCGFECLWWLLSNVSTALSPSPISCLFLFFTVYNRKPSNNLYHQPIKSGEISTSLPPEPGQADYYGMEGNKAEPGASRWLGGLMAAWCLELQLVPHCRISPPALSCNSLPVT